ncbi:Crp/Fnr family transcriptional regulator [Egibacter rhizosphaerae]|uniref:Crp/Fnr family transcriptional regulator n=1 Tax=Egibacter rhizosphaerae TaxID=1670831 RepID=A0A411YIV9_9ACTN|nr:Crp/Fnr family transcriptional regulator [Egibacter rhizosphaerae]QBI21059.1 Crp/Fnr family transcriptional regulator [Egibacter rhizosphaerae]
MSSPRRTPLQIADADPRTCTHDVRVRALARAPLFADLDERSIADVDHRCGMRSVQAGEAIYRAGQPAERLYVLAQGAAKITRPTSEGEELLSDVLAPGDYLGVLPALGEDRYPDSAWALVPACLLSLTGPDLDVVLRNHPSVARAGLAVVGGRLRDSQATAHRLAAATAEQRLAAALLLLADRLGVRRDGGTLINAPIARDDLADLAGCAPETASRTLARLQRDEVLETGRRWIKIADREALEALAPAS